VVESGRPSRNSPWCTHDFAASWTLSRMEIEVEVLSQAGKTIPLRVLDLEGSILSVCLPSSVVSRILADQIHRFREALHIQVLSPSELF
jgi:hypothetical protein